LASAFGGGDVGVSNSTVGLCLAVAGLSCLVSTGTSLFGFVGLSSFSPVEDSSLILEDSSLILGDFSSFTLDDDFFFFGELGVAVPLILDAGVEL